MRRLLFPWSSERSILCVEAPSPLHTQKENFFFPQTAPPVQNYLMTAAATKYISKMSSSFKHVVAQTVCMHLVGCITFFYFGVRCKHEWKCSIFICPSCQVSSDAHCSSCPVLLFTVNQIGHRPHSLANFEPGPCFIISLFDRPTWLLKGKWLLIDAPFPPWKKCAEM